MIRVLHSKVAAAGGGALLLCACVGGHSKQRCCMSGLRARLAFSFVALWRWSLAVFSFVSGIKTLREGCKYRRRWLISYVPVDVWSGPSHRQIPP